MLFLLLSRLFFTSSSVVFADGGAQEYFLPHDVGTLATLMHYYVIIVR